MSGQEMHMHSGCCHTGHTLELHAQIVFAIHSLVKKKKEQFS
jgi:hypothetical protein